MAPLKRIHHRSGSRPIARWMSGVPASRAAACPCRFRQRSREPVVEIASRHEALSIRRVRDDRARRNERHERAGIVPFDDELDPGIPRVVARPCERVFVEVARAHGRSVTEAGVSCLLPEVAKHRLRAVVVARPSLEAESLPRPAGRDAQRPGRGLDGERPRAAHGIEKRPLPIPPREPHDRRREVLRGEARRPFAGTPASLVKPTRRRRRGTPWRRRARDAPPRRRRGLPGRPTAALPGVRAARRPWRPWSFAR